MPLSLSCLTAEDFDEVSAPWRFQLEFDLFCSELMESQTRSVFSVGTAGEANLPVQSAS